MTLLSPFRFIFRHWIVTIVILLIVGLSTWGIAILRTPKPPEYITAVSTKGDILQTVEAVGRVTSEKDLELKFPQAGLVAEVIVKEGDKVKAGDILSTLKADSLAASVQSARASVQSAQAELRALEEGTRPEDIAIAEAQVENSRASLEVAKSTLATSNTKVQTSEEKMKQVLRERDTSLRGNIANANSTVSLETSKALLALNTINDVLDDKIVGDVFIKHVAGERELLLKKVQAARTHVDALIRAGSTADTYDEAIELLTEARSALAEIISALTSTYNTVTTLPETPYFTDSVRETHKSSLSTQIQIVQTSSSTISTQLKTVQDSGASYSTQIAAEEDGLEAARGAAERALADIRTFETSINIQLAQLNLKKAGTRQADIDAARARVNRALADLAQAQANFNDTILRAPIDGTVTKVNLKQGEFTPGQFTTTDPAVTLLGDSPYRVEMYIAEVDIPKIQVSQSGSIELDAFPGTKYAIRVSEIDPASSNVDGVSKYLVRLDFIHPHDQFKIGMTGDAEIYTGSRRDIVKVPVRAVVESSSGSAVVRTVQPDGVTLKENPVVTGMEGISDIEIVSGLQEGETVVVLVKE